MASKHQGQFVDRRRRPFQRALYKLLLAGIIDMNFRMLRRHVNLLVILSFTVVALYVWWSALLDLPHLLLGTPARPFLWLPVILESLLLLLLLLLVLAVLKVFFKRIRYLEGFLPVCSFCKSIRVGERWIPIEQFMQEHSDVRMTHSLCEPCAKKHYAYEAEGRPGDDAD